MLFIPIFFLRIIHIFFGRYSWGFYLIQCVCMRSNKETLWIFSRAERTLLPCAEVLVVPCDP